MNDCGSLHTTFHSKYGEPIKKSRSSSPVPSQAQDLAVQPPIGPIDERKVTKRRKIRYVWTVVPLQSHAVNGRLSLCRFQKSLGASSCAQALLKSAKRESSFYRVGLEWNNGPKVTDFTSLGYYTLFDGTYRRLDCQV